MGNTDAFVTYGYPPRMVMRLAALYTGRSKWTLRRAVNDGALQVAGRCGRSMVFDRAALDAYLVGTVPASRAAEQHPRRNKGTRDALARLRSIARGA